MHRIPLGPAGFTVSAFCLGTMTFGSQTDEADAQRQMAMALDHGVTFWDSAEMYPTNPVRAETVGDSEAILGRFLKTAGGRDRVEIATKITGAGQAAVRDGAPITPETIRPALEASLRRLGTDYVDLYQLHWPNRGSYHFRRHWTYRPGADRDAVVAHVDGVLEVLAALVSEGKVRAVGLSNESVWGAGLWRSRAAVSGGPPMASVQNEYSLLCRQADTDWAEFSRMEDMPLLAFSPLAAGILTGKYAAGAVPPGSRRAATPDLGGRLTPRVDAAVAAYHAVASRHGLDPVQMALAFCRSRPFECIPILGATTEAQLARQLPAADLALGEAVLDDIAAAYKAHPLPY